jgi:hypothetical protein
MRLAPAILVFAGLAAAGPAVAQERGVQRTLLDRALHERQVRLLGIDTATVSYEEGGLVRNEPSSEHLAVLPPPPPPPQHGDLRRSAEPQSLPAPASFLQLTDGQLLTGSLAADHAPGAESVRWSHPVLGAVELKLDQVLRIRFPDPPDRPAAAPLAPSASADRVLLANGDRIEGFVEAVAPALIISVADQKRTIPLDRVREIALANPAEAPRGPFALLRDGSVLSVREVHTGRMGEVTLTPAMLQSSESAEPVPSSPLALADIRAYVFDAAAVLPLAEVPITRQSPDPGRRWSPPAAPSRVAAVLGVRDIELPGAMTVEWKLPDSATRLATTLRLPRSAWNWGQCRVSVSVRSASGASTLLESALSADSPEAPLNAALPPGAGRTLIIALETGPYGPVQTRLTLDRPLLLAAPARP